MFLEISYLWIVIAFMAFIFELIIPGTFAFLFIGISALLTAIISMLFQLNWLMSVVTFGIFAIAIISFGWNKYESSWKVKKHDNPNSSINMLVGQAGTVLSVQNNELKIKIDSHIWSAQLGADDKPVDVGATVWVIGAHKMTLIVSSHRKTGQSEKTPL